MKLRRHVARRLAVATVVGDPCSVGGSYGFAGMVVTINNWRIERTDEEYAMGFSLLMLNEHVSWDEPPMSACFALTMAFYDHPPNPGHALFLFLWVWPRRIVWPTLALAAFLIWKWIAARRKRRREQPAVT